MQIAKNSTSQFFLPRERSARSKGAPDNGFLPCAANPTSPFRAHDRDLTPIKHNPNACRSFPPRPFCVKLTPMGSKDKGRKEVKKAPKPKPKPEPGRKREGFAPAPPK